MSLDDPTKKMSKSAANPASRINMLDDPKTIKQKIGRATTDSERLAKFDPQRPGITNLLTIYEMLTGKSQQDIETKFADSGYGAVKAAVTEQVIATLEPIQKRYYELMNDLPALENILKQGADEVRPLAESTMRDIKKVVGLG